MPVLHVHDVADPRLDDFRDLATSPRLGAKGLFIAEGRLVVERLLTESTVTPESVLLTEAAYTALAPALERWEHELPVWIVPRAWMEPLTGYNLHRGCLAVAHRPAPRTVDDLIADGPRRLLVLEGVSNPDNIGGLFRTGRAFGVDGIVLGPGCGDPLYRKAIRVSCGAALVVPFAIADEWPRPITRLRDAGIRVIALAPAPGLPSIDDAAADHVPCAPLALLLGAEGAGLTMPAMAAADLAVRIPIDPRSDSLNVTVAAGIALFGVRRW